MTNVRCICVSLYVFWEFVKIQTLKNKRFFRWHRHLLWKLVSFWHLDLNTFSGEIRMEKIHDCIQTCFSVNNRFGCLFVKSFRVSFADFSEKSSFKLSVDANMCVCFCLFSYLCTRFLVWIFAKCFVAPLAFCQNSNSEFSRNYHVFTSDVDLFHLQVFLEINHKN